MGFSAFDKRLLEEGLAYFAQPRLATFLELLGTTKFDRVETLTTMLRNASREELDEAAAIFDRVLARLEQDRAAEERRTRRSETAAERRERRERRARDR
jgi:hypothetical protein